MKKYMPVFMVLFVLIALVCGVFWHNRGVQAVNIKVNVRDLPEHGLLIIGPSEPSFDGHVSALLKGKANPVVEALKPFSVFIKNIGRNAVVAYQLRWEMVRADGTVVTREMGGSNPRALMDGGAPGLEYLSTTSGYAIRPGSTRFVSPVMALDEDQTGNLGAYAGGSSDQNDIPQLQQAMRDKNLAPMFDTIARELYGYKSMTVSVDGAFFEDGTFVGPDNTHFFTQVKAEIDAKRDLLNEIAFARNHNRNQKDIFSDVEAWANNPGNNITPNATSTDYYNYYKSVYADEVLHMRKAMGEDKAIALALQPLRKQWCKLEKR